MALLKATNIELFKTAFVLVGWSSLVFSKFSIFPKLLSKLPATLRSSPVFPASFHLPHTHSENSTPFGAAGCSV
jgi:hypothetical protein